MINDIQSVKDVIDALELDRGQKQELLRHLTYGPINKPKNIIQYNYNCMNCEKPLFISPQMIENFYHINTNCKFCNLPFNTLHTRSNNIPE